MRGKDRKMEENAVSRGYLQEEFRLFHNRDTLGAVTELHYHDFYKIMMQELF